MQNSRRRPVRERVWLLKMFIRDGEKFRITFVVWNTNQYKEEMTRMEGGKE